MNGQEEAVRQAGKVSPAWCCDVLALCSLPLTVSCGHFHGFFGNLEHRSSHILHALIQRNNFFIIPGTLFLPLPSSVCKSSFVLAESKIALLTSLSDI